MPMAKSMLRMVARPTSSGVRGCPKATDQQLTSTDRKIGQRSADYRSPTTSDHDEPPNSARTHKRDLILKAWARLVRGSFRDARECSRLATVNVDTRTYCVCQYDTSRTQTVDARDAIINAIKIPY